MNPEEIANFSQALGLLKQIPPELMQFMGERDTAGINWAAIEQQLARIANRLGEISEHLEKIKNVAIK